MNTRLLPAFLGLVAALPLYGQVVSDGATNTLSNVTNTFAGDVTVGTNGSFTLLVLSGNALLTNLVNGIIGLNTTARSNEVRLVSPTSRWLMGGDLNVGQNGAFNRLVVSNGGIVSDATGTIGSESVSLPVANSNAVVVTGSGSLWNNTNNLYVGLFGAGNQLVVSNSGTVMDRFGIIGGSSGSNAAVITGSGSAWMNSREVWVGQSGHSNRLTVSNGGLVVNSNSILGLSFSRGNETIVTGSGSLWSNRLDLTVGSFASPANRLVVSNGGMVFVARDVFIGSSSSANSNTVIVTDAGSSWLVASNLYVGSNGASSLVVVSNSGTTFANQWLIGADAGSTGNRVVVDGGTLRVTNAAGTSVLDVRRGTNVLNAGLIELDRLLVTNSAGRFEFNGGTLSLGQSTIDNGLSFNAGDGARLATLNLTANGTHSFASNLIVRSNATVMGNGTILAPITSAQAGSKIAPGTAPGDIGRLSSSGSVELRGFSHMEISKSGGVLTNDQFQAASISYFGGSLVLAIKIGPDALTVGDRFQLFVAGSYSVGAAIVLPGLAPGLRWVNNLGVDGSIEVESLAPSVQTLPASGLSQTSATLNGMADPKGTNTSAWFEYGFTTNYGNITTPQALGSGVNPTNFSRILTNLFGGVTYHFRAVASNSFGVAFGGDQVFTTLAASVATLPASAVGSTNATLNGMANPQGVDLVAWFEWGFSTNFGYRTAPIMLGSGTNSVNFSEPLTGLAVNVVHHFRAVASNSFGILVGANQSFFPPRTNAFTVDDLGVSGLDDFYNYGASVAVSGDTAVIGLPGDRSSATGVNGNHLDTSAPSSGAAYVFVRNGTSWSKQAYLKASDTKAGDRFGISVAISGDTVVVGADFEDSNATGVNGNQSNTNAFRSGAAYVFVRNGTNWSQQAYLKASNTEVDDRFGTSVAVSGDSIVIGADNEDSNATGVNGNQTDNSAMQSGAAYVFVRNGTTWTQQAYLKASNTEAVDLFGHSVSVSSDTIVIGAAGEDSNATGINGDQNNNGADGAGAAYVFVRTGTNWTQQAYLKRSDGEAGGFGGSVAASGERIVVGRPAQVFVRNGTTWSQEARLKLSATATNGILASSVAISSGTVVVVAVSNVIMFEVITNSWVVSGLLLAGEAVAVSGDNIIVGEGGYDTTLPFPPFTVLTFDGGRAFAYTRNSIEPTLQVEQSGHNLPNDGDVEFLAAGLTSGERTFTLRNLGDAGLHVASVTMDGPDSAMFSVIVSPAALVAPASNTTFTVRFAPTSIGPKSAALHIASNDDEQNPFNIDLNGLSLSFAEDRDGDGLNDASEVLLSPFGFDFRAPQTNLVGLLFSNLGGATPNLNAAGFFTQSQLQALNVDSPLLVRDSLTGLFTLTIGVQKATQLTNFLSFPMTAPQTAINAEGKLEFQFSSPEGAAFFRLDAQ